MRVVMVGDLDLQAMSEFYEVPLVVLTGTPDEVRAAGAMLFQDVELKAPPTSPNPSKESNGE